MLSGLHKHGLGAARGEQWYLPEEPLTPAQLGAGAVDAHLYAIKMWLYELLSEQCSCNVLLFIPLTFSLCALLPGNATPKQTDQ